MRYYTEYNYFEEEEVLFKTPAIKIGNHEWRMLVYKIPAERIPSYLLKDGVTEHRYTTYQWRQVYSESNMRNFPWQHMTKWPTYNNDDGMDAGCPRSLRTKIYDVYEREIKAAKGEPMPEEAQMALAF